MRALILFFLLTAPTLAQAENVFDRAAGLYGNADPSEQSCATNPHQLSFSDSPPHADFRLAMPVTAYDGSVSDHFRYDIITHDDNSITMRLEGESRRTVTGERVIWILRLTSDPQGYCWGRTDWPLLRCEHPATRCDQVAPSS